MNRKVPVVYVLPCRIQQGWGDVVEMARASVALARAGFPLAFLGGEGAGSPERRQGGDPRALPVDPARCPWAGFPPMKRLDRPVGGRPALVLATWWGITARRADSEGGPVPGTLADREERIVRSHGRGKVLHVSLEEFASAASSRTAAFEAFRQAGWDDTRIRRHLASRDGRAWVEAYHRAYGAARGGDRDDVLHLVGGFSRSPGAVREFPFLIEVGPYSFPARPRSRERRQRGSGQRALWYASPDDSLPFARELAKAMEPPPGRRLRLEIRPSDRMRERFERWALQAEDRGETDVEVLPEQAPRAWRRRMASADLVIAGGSQSLVDAIALGRPFLYFNGLMRRAAGGQSRAFRREKLLSVARALNARGVPQDIVNDLLDFADGKDIGKVATSALFSSRWRTGLAPFLHEGKWPPWDLPPSRMDGGDYLVDVARRFASGEGVEDLVRSLRASSRREVGVS